MTAGAAPRQIACEQCSVPVPRLIAGLRQRLASSDGATLVELLVVTLLLGIIGSIVAGGVISGLQVSRHAEGRVQALTAIHSTLAGMSREIRAADSRSTLRPAAVHDAALLAAAPARLETDVLRDSTRVRFTYELDGGVLRQRRRVWSDPSADPAVTAASSDSTRDLLADVANSAGAPLFAYRRSDGSCISGCAGPDGALLTAAVSDAQLADVGEVTITVQRGLGDERPPIEVVTRITLRNA